MTYCRRFVVIIQYAYTACTIADLVQDSSKCRPYNKSKATTNFKKSLYHDQSGKSVNKWRIIIQLVCIYSVARPTMTVLILSG